MVARGTRFARTVAQSKRSHAADAATTKLFRADPAAAGDTTAERVRGFGRRGAPRVRARDGLCVVEDFFDDATFAACQRSARRQRELKPETLESVAVGRLGCFLEPRDPVCVALSRPESVERLRRICGDDRLEPADFPVELRRYPVGSSMGWHKDEVLYEEPQLEVVLTLENTSDSQTRWERADGSVRGAWLPPNSLLLVKAEGATHGVTTVRRGDRLIAKFVLTASPTPRGVVYDNILSYQAQP